MKKNVINAQEYNIDEKLKDYEICPVKDQGSIQYYGHDGKNIFFQFIHGVSYIYAGVDKKFITELNKTESLPRFMANLSRQYQFSKSSAPMVRSKNITED